MLREFTRRQPRKEDTSASYVIQQLKERFDLRSSVIHTTVSSASYEYKRDGMGKTRYVVKPNADRRLNGYLRDFAIFHDAGEEAEANIFAAELLMPEFLFKPRSRGRVPSLGLVDTLAEEFGSSTMATAFQYIHYTNEQVALVVSDRQRILWTKKVKDFWPRIQTERIHPHSAVGKIISGKAGNTNKMVRSPAYAWLDNFRDDSEREIMEDTRYIEYYEQFITLLWMKDDLSD